MEICECQSVTYVRNRNCDCNNEYLILLRYVIPFWKKNYNLKSGSFFNRKMMILIKICWILIGAKNRIAIKINWTNLSDENITAFNDNLKVNARTWFLCKFIWKRCSIQARNLREMKLGILTAVDWKSNDLSFMGFSRQIFQTLRKGSARVRTGIEESSEEGKPQIEYRLNRVADHSNT